MYFLNLNSELLLEKFLENPFLEKFYKDIDKYALSTQLHFLLQRKADLSKLDSVGSNNKNYVSDYFINKDKLFAKTVLSRNEFELYTKIFDALNITIPKPDLIIYLQAEPDILLERIKLRGN